jgi:hypothetical protein
MFGDNQAIPKYLIHLPVCEMIDAEILGDYWIDGKASCRDPRVLLD